MAKWVGTVEDQDKTPLLYAQYPKRGDVEDAIWDFAIERYGLDRAGCLAAMYQTFQAERVAVSIVKL